MEASGRDHSPPPGTASEPDNPPQVLAGDAGLCQRAAPVRMMTSTALDAVLTGTADPHTALRATAALLTEELADLCLLKLVDASGQLQLHAQAHPTPETAARLARLWEAYPPRPEDAHGAYAVLRQGMPQFLCGAERLLDTLARDATHRTQLAALELDAWLWLPLQLGERTLGVLSLAWTGQGHPCGPAERRIAEELVPRLALAAENLRLADTLARERGERARETHEREYAEAEVQRLNRDAHHRLDELQTLFEVAPVGLALAHDPHGHVITMNPAAARLRGIDPERNASLTGAEANQLPYRAMRAGRPVAAEELPMQYALSQRTVVDGMELDLVFDDGRVITLYEYASPLYDEHGEVRGGLGVFIDITPLKRVEAALRESRERLLAALCASGTGTFRMDIGSGHLQLDENLRHLLGVPPQAQLTNLDALLERVHPEERARFETCLAASASSGCDLNAQFRVRGTDGQERWLAAKAKTLYSGQTREPLYMTGAILDVTERRRAMEALRTSEERFRMALIGSPIVVFAHDAELRYTWIHNSTVSNFGHPLGKRDDELLPHAPYGRRLYKLKRRVFESGRGERREIGLKVNDTLHFFDITVEPRRDETGRIVGLLGAAVDITHRKKLEAQLRRQARLLRHADQRKDEFLAMLAHELRNPLAPIRNAVRLLKRRGENADPQLRWAGEIIERQAQQMTRLVDDLLDVARITQGRITLKRQPVPLDEVMARAVETVSPQLDASGHQLILSLPAPQVWLDADQARLAQTVANLLHNAGKYSEPGSEIRVTAQRRDEEVEISVRDSGVGIAPDLLPRIFDLFSQADSSLDRSQGGLGLGLTLVRTLVEMHGGSVRASSEGEGRGSEFVIRLPCLAQPPGESLTPSPCALAAQPIPRPDSGRRQVLVVDDNRDAATSFAFLLESLGHEVHSVYSGTDALVAWARFRPQLVFLDIGLPGLDGYETARRLRAKDGGQSCTLVALTGYGDAETRRRCTETGFDHYLLKPGELETIERLLAQSPRIPS